MTHLKRASTRIATAVFSVVVFGLAIGTLPVYADANPDNEGHHYGQLKHPKHPPVPAPSPAPAPVPTPLPSGNPVHTVVPTVEPVTAAVARGIAHSSLQVPDVKLNPAPSQAGQARAASSRPVPQDPLWWLVLVILPALLAIWLIALKRLTDRPPSMARAQESRPQTAGAELLASPQV